MPDASHAPEQDAPVGEVSDEAEMDVPITTEVSGEAEMDVPITAEVSGAAEMDVPAAVPDVPGAPDVTGRRLHPLTLLFTAGEMARQMIIPAFVSGVSAGGGEAGRIIAIVFAVLAVPAAAISIARYARFRYALAGDELVIRSGLLSRRHRVIPLARVQNVDVQQGVLQRLLRVAELRVETAGAGSEAEAALSVLGAADAQALRGELLARRRAARARVALSTAVDVAEDPEAAAPESDGVLLKKLSLWEVILAGATANEAGVIAAAVAGGLQLVDDVGLPYLERLGDVSDWVKRAGGAGAGAVVAVTVAMILLLLLVGWIVSIAGAVARYHGFTLRRVDGELRKRYGLLTLHEASVPLERVQAIRVEESILRRPLGLASLMIETAGAAPGQGGERSGGAEAFVPLARRDEVAGLVRGIFGDFDLDATPLRQVHPRARPRAARRWAVILFLPALVLAATAVLAEAYLPLLFLLPVLPLPWLLARREYAVRGYAVAGGYVVARAGLLGRVTWIVPEHKLQTLHLHQSPMQRRHGLASLVVDTAAGGRQAAIADLGADHARELLDALASGVREAARARRRLPRVAV
ncbi:MAG TPA: PH domain-containing protein [Longimicrobium sp.]|nr:PH domain-containing protein [Longimicrobium sp.]